MSQSASVRQPYSQSLPKFNLPSFGGDSQWPSAFAVQSASDVQIRTGAGAVPPAAPGPPSLAGGGAAPASMAPASTKPSRGSLDGQVAASARWRRPSEQ